MYAPELGSPSRKTICPASKCSSRPRAAICARTSVGILPKTSVVFRKAVRSRMVRVASMSCARGEREPRPGGGITHQRVEGGEVGLDQREQRPLLARPD